MTDDQLRLKERIVALSRDPGFKAELNQVRAKSLLQEVAHEVPPYDWKYIVNRFVRNCTAISWGLETLIVSASEPVKELEDEVRQLAFAWESLAKLGEGVNRRTALLNAALAYELAGYQASATCLARQLTRQIPGDHEATLEDLVAFFLDRRFLQVLQLCSQVRQRLESPDKPGPQDPLTTGKVLASQGLESIMRFLMRGHSGSYEAAQQLLGLSESIYEAAGATNETVTLRGLRSIIPQIHQRSTWFWLSPQLIQSPRWERYLKLLARGIGAYALRNRSISELWKSQQIALESGFLKENQSWIIRMPTSAGKTRIAEMAIAKTLIEQAGSKCIYVAPYRALVWEIEDTLIKVFTDLGFRVSSIIGSYETDDFEDFLFRNTDVLITTPEKLDLVYRAQPEFLDNVRLVVLDEGHIADDRSRGAKFELLLTRLKRKLSQARFLFISAVVPEQTLEDFATWIGADYRQIITSDWRPSVQRTARFHWRGRTGVIRYSGEEDISGLHEFVPGVIARREYEYINPQTLRVNHVRFPGSSRAHTAAELAIRFTELGAVLVFCSQPSFAEAVANSIQTALSLRRLVEEAIPSYFQHAPVMRSTLAAEEWLGSEHPVTKALRNGIAVHHGDLPEVVRRAIEADFRANRYQVIVATNTLAQGVNLPIRTVVIHSCRRYDPVTQSSERIPARDYWNVAGRAGRAGIETDGTIIHMVFNDRDEQDFNYYMDKANIEPVRGALFHMLSDLLSERMSEEALGAELDSEVLAMLVEEGLTSPEREHLEQILGQSLVHIQAVRENLDFARLADAVVNVARNQLSTVTDVELRKAYASTGLSTKSCEFIRESIAAQLDTVNMLFREAGIGQLSQLAELFLQCCMNLSEMQPDREFGGDYVELLVSWISGDSPGVLAQKFEDQVASMQELSRFMEEFFGYRLPWGISACIKIASAALKLEPDELSEFVRYFPSMTKYGLADPKACWLMSVGVPSRKIASLMAAAFQAENTKVDYDSFLEWLGSLNEDRLRDEFNLSGPVLEDVARTLFRSRSNPLLASYPDASGILPIEVEVKGIRYENRSVVAQQVRQGEALGLVRDYDNPVDSNAIKVVHPRGELGFVPHETAQLLALEIDTGLRLTAKVTAVTPGKIPAVRITIAKQADNLS